MGCVHSKVRLSEIQNQTFAPPPPTNHQYNPLYYRTKEIKGILIAPNKILTVAHHFYDPFNDVQNVEDMIMTIT